MTGAQEAEPMDRTCAAVLLKEEVGGYSVVVPALPGCFSQGDDLPEALWMAQDAIQGYVSVLEEDGDPIPPDVDTVAFDWGDAREALVYKVTVREAVAVA